MSINPASQHHHHGPHHHHHKDKHKTGENGTGEIKELSVEQLDSLRSTLNKFSLPILLGTDDQINKWKLESGDNFEAGMIFSFNHPEYGKVWKVQFMLDAPAEMVFNAITLNFDHDWIPNLHSSKVLSSATDEHVILQQRICGVTAVSDRDFVVVQFPNKAITKKGNFDVTHHYSLIMSIPEGNYYNSKEQPGVVRGEYLPSGWSWATVDDQANKSRCLSTMIYNLNLRGYLPKQIVNLAATTFLTRHIKAAQKHASELAAKAGLIVNQTPARRT